MYQSMSWCCEDAERYRVLHDKWPVVSYGRKALVRRSLHSLYPTQLGGLAISFDHLHVLYTLYMLYICIYRYICFIMFYYVLSHLDSKVATARPSESLTCRAFSKLVSPGNPWLPRLLRHHWMVVTRKTGTAESDPACGGKVGCWGCWVLLSQTSPKMIYNDLNCYHLEGDSLMSQQCSTYIWTRCHRN